MAIRNVATRGFGNGTFGASHVATRGFGIGRPPPQPPDPRLYRPVQRQLADEYRTSARRQIEYRPGGLVVPVTAPTVEH